MTEFLKKISFGTIIRIKPDGDTIPNNRFEVITDVGDGEYVHSGIVERNHFLYVIPFLGTHTTRLTYIADICGQLDPDAVVRAYVRGMNHTHREASAESIATLRNASTKGSRLIRLAYEQI